MKSYWWSW